MAAAISAEPSYREEVINSIVDGMWFSSSIVNFPAVPVNTIIDLPSDLYRNPDDGNHHVHTLGLTTVVLETPQTVGFLIPERLGCRVHAAPPDMGLAVRGGSNAVAAGADVRLVGFGLASSLGLVQRRRGDQVLDDSAINNELV